MARRLLLASCLALAAAALGAGCREASPAERERPIGEAALAHAVALCAERPARLAGRDSRAVLVSHFDTKAGVPGFVGANDGASTTGLLLALAGEGALPVAYLFTDGEECRVAYSAEDGLTGAWRAARSGRIPKDVPVIVLDMLGDAALNPVLAANGSPWLNARIRRAARETGLRVGDGGAIVDDHLPFVAEGYRAADLIDFDYGPGNAWWHTAEDTPDKLSADSLARTAALVRRLIDLLEQDHP